MVCCGERKDANGLCAMTPDPSRTITVDVVIPVFNGERYLERAVASVEAQSARVGRIIIADDGSNDDTPALAQQLQQRNPRILYLPLPHKGVSAARNAGIRAASAPFIAFLDADDIWLPQKLKRQLAAFAEGGEAVGFVHSSYFIIDENDGIIEDARIFPPKQRGDIFLPLLNESYVLSGSASSVLVKRDVLDAAGYYDERLFHGEDWDLWIRLARISHVNFTREAVVGIRVHSQSAQRRPRPERALEFFKQHLIIYAKWYELLGQEPQLKSALRRQAADAILPLLRRPLEADRFYRSLKKDDSTLGRSLFKNRIHFCFAVTRRILATLWWRLKRKVGMDDA